MKTKAPEDRVCPLARLISHLFLISHFLKEKKRVDSGHIIIVESNMAAISGAHSLSETSSVLAIAYVCCIYMI